MDWELILIMMPLAVLCWWVGYKATERMRLEKNRMREEAAQKRRAAAGGGE